MRHMFCIGDILIKIDTRAWTSESFDTRHHAMLVVDVTEGGFPVIAHMKFTDFEHHTGSLIIENCPSAKDLFLIHCPGFSMSLRGTIQKIALQAHLHNQLRIDQSFLEKEYKKSFPYRPDDSADTIKKKDLLRKQLVTPADILQNQCQYISCHDFVLSAIHLACQQSNHTIPQGLNIPPQLAWSDLLFAFCGDDDALHLTEIRKIAWPNIELARTLAKQESQFNPTFFSGLTSSQHLKKSSTSYCCIT